MENVLSDYAGGWWNGCHNCGKLVDEIADCETDEIKQEFIDDNLVYKDGWLCKECYQALSLEIPNEDDQVLEFGKTLKPTTPFLEKTD